MAVVTVGFLSGPLQAADSQPVIKPHSFENKSGSSSSSSPSGGTTPYVVEGESDVVEGWGGPPYEWDVGDQGAYPAPEPQEVDPYDGDAPVSSEPGSVPAGEPGVSGGGSSGSAGIDPYNQDFREEDHMEDPVRPHCNFSDWVGKPVDEAALKATGRPWRVLGPQDQITMEYMIGRINVIAVDGVVQSVTCG